MNDNDIIVIGAGSFGTALAISFSYKNPKVTLIARTREHANKINTTRQNKHYLPNIDLPKNLICTEKLEIVAKAKVVLLAVPSQAQREMAQKIKPYCSKDTALVICAKGLERKTGLFLADVISQELPGQKTFVLSGPGFAADIAKKLPTAMTIAGNDLSETETLAQTLSSPTFRLYANDDVVGVQTGGALKNVLAIAAGIVDGCQFGESARAALIARGLREISEFAAAKQGRYDTVAGLSGLGDLVLTATSTQSRNYRFGLQLGQGKSIDALLKPEEPLVEGAFTAKVAAREAIKLGIQMPITQSIAQILDAKIDIKTAVNQLMTRPLRRE